MSKEKLTNSIESGANKLSSAEASEQLERIRESLESSKGEEKKHDAEALKSKIEKIATPAETTSKKAETNNTQPDNIFIDKNQTFYTTLKTVQQEMTKTQRTFSHVIHNRVIERVSDITDKTVARPSIMLGAFSFSAIGSFIVYLIAHRNGYPINSHFIVLALMIMGAVSGLFVEFTYKVIRRIR